MERGDLEEEHTFVFENRNTFFQRLEAILEENTFLDVTLCCEGLNIRAHRIVLASCSPYFTNILRTTSCNEPTFVFGDISKHEMMYLIDYIYKGSVKVPRNFLTSFQRLLKKFEIDVSPPSADNDPMEHTEFHVTTTSLSYDLATAGVNPVLHERQNISKIGIPGTSKETARSYSGSVKRQDQHTVINPYACKSKSPIRPVRSNGAPKKKTECRTSHHMSKDSDMEVIEIDGTVLVISDTPESSSPEFCSKLHRPPKRGCAVALDKSPLMSNSSDFARPTSMKRIIPVIDSSEEEIEPSVQKSHKQASSKAVTDVGDIVPSTSKKDRCTRKTDEVINFDAKTFREMKNFCVVCKANKKNLLRHINQYHKFPIRKKRFICDVCFKKFAFRKFLEFHVCKK